MYKNLIVELFLNFPESLEKIASHESKEVCQPTEIFLMKSILPHDYDFLMNQCQVFSC